MYKIGFLPTGSLRHEPVAYHGLSEMMALIVMYLTSLWVCSHLHFPSRVRLCSAALGAGSFGGNAGLADRSPLSPLELYPVLNVSIRGNKLSHRHRVQGCCSAARDWLWEKQTLGQLLPLVNGF